MRPSRGFALVPLLLLLTAGLGVAAALLALTGGTHTATSVELERIQARLIAESGLRGLVLQASSLALPMLGTQTLGSYSTPNGGRIGLELARLSAEIFLFRATGHPARGGGRHDLARILWRLDPGTRLAGMTAAVEVGFGVSTVSSRIDGDSVLLSPTGWPAAVCASWAPLLAVSFPAGRVPATAGSAASPGLGPLDLSALSSFATAVPAGVLTVGPAFSAGACATAVISNWGSPGDPTGPCGGHIPLLTSSGPLTVSGGEGQGVLLVAGDLTLTGGVRFSGLVLVGGNLHLSGGTRLEGFVQVGGSATLVGGSAIVASGCPAARALASAAAQMGGVPLPDGGWVEPF